VSTIIRKCRDIDIGHEIHAVLGDLVYGETTYGNKKKNDRPLNLTLIRVISFRNLERDSLVGASVVELCNKKRHANLEGVIACSAGVHSGHLARWSAALKCSLTRQTTY
jgi:hypothetical protein